MAPLPALLVEAAGWIAAVLILGAYLLVSAGQLSGQSRTFQWMNAVGAAGFVLNTSVHHAWPSAAMNLAWLLIAVVALWRIARRTA